ncbi:MAG: hypothetical protein A2591_02495 [Candidatus Yonathbacteria bacterium RIFOXYD1_FULL_52_36]|uniref:Macrocin O-methyltransferase n=1 Tax=Candidatus Yonathbacteria bacterium RIFOXYD1_FULL_52_36 TaxID=1802730 RepID=A0A1G2SLZ3_9BACT|nr:MAG: hypothetical protein A2591_02495 [Candidatus Yonathbacteria bacterium RIFOXYD1_FULL_52_36]
MKHTLKKFLNRFGFDVVRYPTILFDGRRMDIVLYLNFLFNKLTDIPGDIVECGVGKGRSFLMLAFLTQREGKPRAVWGFDSFEGFPEPSKHDASARNPKKGEWSGTRPEDITAILRNAGMVESFIKEKVKLVPGFFENTVHTYDGPGIALLHIDADLYDSYVVVLEKLFPLVAKGGVVLFDEYNQKRWPGAKKAVDEFLQGTPYKLEKVPFAEKYFIVK